MKDTPLAVENATGIIYINHKLYDKLSPFEKKFWMLHEKGHYFLDTDDEIKADNYAFDRLAGKEFRSLKQMIEATENLLDENNPYHKARIDNMYRRAIQWDKTHPGIHKATSSQISAMLAGMQTNLETMGTMLIGAQRASSDTASKAQNSAAVATTMSSGTIILIIVLALILLRK